MDQENKHLEEILDEQKESKDHLEEAEEAVAVRPTSGIHPETLTDIDNDTKAV